LSPAFAEEIGFDPMVRGVIVIGVDANSAAARVGVKPGDLVLEVNETAVNTVDNLQRLLKAGPRGRWILELRRGSRQFKIAVRS
jgi:serine protease Do